MRLGGPDVGIEPQRSVVLEAGRAREGHEPGDMQAHRGLVCRSRICCALVDCCVIVLLTPL